jgi:hypothetical protein
MPISEAARNDLYTGLSEVLGPKRAETLMSVIRLQDLDEVATKRDIAELRAELKAEIAPLIVGHDSLSASVGRLEQKLDRLIFVLIAGLFAVIATLIGVGLTI